MKAPKLKKDESAESFRQRVAEWERVTNKKYPTTFSGMTDEERVLKGDVRTRGLTIPKNYYNEDYKDEIREFETSNIQSIPEKDLDEEFISQLNRGDVDPYTMDLPTPIPTDTESTTEDAVLYKQPVSDFQYQQLLYKQQIDAEKQAAVAKIDASAEYAMPSRFFFNYTSDDTYMKWHNEIDKDGSEFTQLDGSGWYTPKTSPTSSTSSNTTAAAAVQEVAESYPQSKADAELGRTEEQAKESFLTKSNNAAVKSGAFDSDELWELQKRHRSGEWRNKSEVKTGSKDGTKVSDKHLLKEK
tara:strand:+ start:674 stop:1573 length:900 start_codon:yes stop_codon:yes gene_type:complete